MNNNRAMVSCALGSWMVAALAGAFAALLLMVVGSWSFLQAAYMGAVVFGGVGLVLSLIMCRPLPALGEATVPTAASVAPAAQPVAAPAARAAAPVSAKPLPGQDDVTARKGEEKYKAESATAPAAKKAKPAKKPAAKAAAPAADGPGTKPQTLTAARDEGPDDLKQIKGVGPKLEDLLHSMGFYHFDQIASWGADEVSWVDQNLQGFKGRVSRDEWVAQAKILAEGGTTEFSSKVKKGDVY